MARRNILHSSPRNGYITLLFSCSKEITELVLLCPSGFKWLFNLVQSLSHVQHFVTPWTAAHRLPCPSSTPGACSDSCPSSQWCHPTISFILCHPLLLPSIFPGIRVFLVSQFFTSAGQSIRASAAVFPMNIQDWFPLGWTAGSPCTSRDSQESSPTAQFKSINSLVLSLLCGSTLISIHDYWKKHSSDYMDLCWPNNVSAF